jgi:two-component system, OmpR family, phosphate regulon sensor histidine kinase PhoR
MRRRFAPRLALAVGGLLAAAVGALGWAFAEELRRELTGDLTAALVTESKLAALQGGSPAGAASRAAAACGCRATVVAPDGRVLADSELDAAGLAKAENHAARPEVAAALAGRTGHAVRRSATVGVDMLYAAAPGPGGTAVRLALPLTQVARRVSAARAYVLWAALAVLAAALAAAWLLARAAGGPLEDMAAAAAKLAAGDYAARVRGVAPGDERGVLADTLNELAARVEGTVAELTKEHGQFAAVLGQMAEGVVAVDGEGRVLLANPALSRLLGVDAGAAKGRPFVESLRHAGASELLASVLREGRAVSKELRLFAPEELMFDAHCAPLPQGGALLVLHDITRLRRLEQVRRDFVANVSHELRTPLSSIRGFAETLREGAVDDEENRLGFLKTIEEQAIGLQKLVDDLLDLSAIESGHRPPKLAPVELGPLVRETLRRFGPAAAERGVALAASLPDRLAPALADADQTRQVLANLVDNAVKYTEKGGRVDVSARPAGGGLVVDVRDTGAGIPAPDLPRVFERFYRVEKARTREAGGTGLGLAIVKHLVEAQGGRVSVESRQPGGSTFSFFLPSA